MFCDYLNIYQQHDASYGDFLGGRVVSVIGDCGLSQRVVVDDETGELSKAWAFCSGDSSVEVDYSIGTFAETTGSYETKLFVRMIAGRVEVRGNASAYGRRDNLFGLDLDDSIEIYNQVLRSLGLPEFTEGELFTYWHQGKKSKKGENGGFVTEYTGAIITRADITQNLAVGMGNVQNFNRWAVGQKLYASAPDDARLEKFASWNYNTVYLSDSVYWVGMKIYDKSQALLQRTLPEYQKKLNAAVREGKLLKNDALRLQFEMENYLDKLALWCAEMGIARAEWSFKNRWFKQKDGLAYWQPQKTQGELMCIATEQLEKLTGRAVVYQLDAYDKLSYTEKGVLDDWKKGIDLTEILPRTTMFRHRKAILAKTGHDIAARPLVVAENVRPVYFNIKPITVSAAPVWYSRPSLQLAA